MAGQDSTVILRVQLDEQATEKRIGEITVAVTENRKAQQELKKAYDAGKVSADEFGQRSVKLNSELRMQQTEQRNLTKNLDLYRAAVNGVAGSYDQAQAQLTLAQRQFRGLEGSLEDTTEASQALSGVVRDLRGQLKETDANSLDQFFRSIGDYPKPESLTPLIQQLVKLEETMKSGALTAEQAAAADVAAIGYKQRIAQAGAQEGKSYEETTALVKSYGDAIRPATAELLKLEAEQRQVVESGKATGEQVAQIGFRFGAAKKQIADATDALKEVPEAAADGAKETKGLGAGLLDAAKSSDVLGGAVDVLTTAKEKYTAAAELAKVATAGEVTVLGALKLALIATGLGALVVVLGSVIAFLTKTQAGTDFLSRKMAALGAVVRIITNLFVDLGGKIFEAAQNPKQAFEDLVSFIETNLGNRLKAFGVLLDAVRNRDFSKLVDGAVQLTTGLDNATARAKAFTQQINEAANSAERLAQMERELQRAQNDNIATNKTLLNEVERLKNVRDNEFNSIQARKKANEDAYKVELQREKELTKIAQQQIDVLSKKLELEGGRSRNEELFADLQRARNELKDIQEDAAGKQNELITNRYQLEQELIDKSIERRAQAIALDTARLNKQLAQVQANSEQELSLRQQLLNKGREAELNVKNLTVAQKKAIDVKYEQDSLALSLDFNRRRLLAALQAETDLTSARLTQQAAGSAEELQAQTDQIENQRKLAIAGLTVNADNTAKIAAINAQAEQQRRQLEFQQATRDLETYLAEKRRIVENDYASGAIQEQEYQRRLAAIAKAGTDAQAVVNADYRQDNAENRRQADANETEAIRRHTAEVKQTEQAKQEVRELTAQAFVAASDTVIEAFGAESAAGQAALALKKAAALVEVGLSLEKQFAANAETGAKISAIAPPVTTPLGVAYTVAADALAVAAAATSISNILKLQRGGIAYGPSHEQGGIPLYRNGHPAGIEIEGGEPVLTKNVTANPLLLSLASTVNQLAGGRALAPGLVAPRMALGGVAYPALAQQQLAGGTAAIDTGAIGKALAQELRRNPPVNRWADFKAAQSRNAFTDSQSSN